jgi:hypothetical protein
MENECCQEKWIKKRLLWSSDRDNPEDYYADKLELLMDGNERYALRLSVGGEVVEKEIKAITKYV